MSCTVQQRNAVRRAAERLGRLAEIQRVDVLAPDAGPRGTWTCEAVLAGTRVPTAVLRVCADVGVDLVPDATGTRGEPVQTVVVLTA